MSVNIKEQEIREDQEMRELCEKARLMVAQYRFVQCEEMVREAMAECPHAPEPHNLMGILLEKKRDTAGAMRHYRAAWALEPSFAPARENIERFENFSSREPAFTEEDCLSGKKKNPAKESACEKQTGRKEAFRGQEGKLWTLPREVQNSLVLLCHGGKKYGAM